VDYPERGNALNGSNMVIVPQIPVILRPAGFVFRREVIAAVTGFIRLKDDITNGEVRNGFQNPEIVNMIPGRIIRAGCI
jgi:hypothetical protein